MLVVIVNSVVLFFAFFSYVVLCVMCLFELLLLVFVCWWKLFVMARCCV